MQDIVVCIQIITPANHTLPTQFDNLNAPAVSHTSNEEDIPMNYQLLLFILSIFAAQTPKHLQAVQYSPFLCSIVAVRDQFFAPHTTTTTTPSPDATMWLSTNVHMSVYFWHVDARKLLVLCEASRINDTTMPKVLGNLGNRWIFAIHVCWFYQRNLKYRGRYKSVAGGVLTKQSFMEVKKKG